MLFVLISLQIAISIILIPEIIKLEQNNVFGHAQGRNVTAAIRRAAVSA